MDNKVKEILANSKWEDEILELIYSADEYTTSDLQGRVGAIVLQIIADGKKRQKEGGKNL